MPWKENNNGEGPWGEPDQKPSNNSKKKKYVFNIDSIFLSGVDPVELQDRTQTYGKLDPDGRAVYQSEENFITLKTEPKTQVTKATIPP